MKIAFQKCLFALVLAGLAATRLAAQDIIYAAGTAWKTVDMLDVRVKPGTALDLSGLVENGPAGKHGRLQANERGDLVFADAPERAVRINGLNMWPGVLNSITNAPTMDGIKANLRNYVALAKRQGYNMLRFTGFDYFVMVRAEKDLEFNPRNLEIMDYLFYRLKEEGLYLYLDLGFSGLYFKGSWDDKLTHRNIKTEFLLGDPAARDNYRRGIGKVLTHENPFTKTRLLDDPLLAWVNLYNEVEFAYLRPVGKSKAALETRWHDWLKRRYPSAAALGKAWKKPDFAKLGSLDQIPLGQYSTGKDGNDYATFVHEMLAETQTWYQRTLREIGYKGMSSAYDLAYSAFFTDLHDAADLVLMHGYFAHPKPAAMKNGSTTIQTSHISDGASVFRSLGGTRLFDKPFAVTEYNHGFFNQYQHEGGLVFGAYAALQQWQCLLAFCNPVHLVADEPMEAFRSGLSPVARANDFLVACLYLRGDVAASPHRVEARITPEQMAASMFPALNTDQTRLALISGFGVRYSASPRTKASRKPDLELSPSSGSAVSTTDANATVQQSASSTFSLAKAVDNLRRTGILPANNLSDPNAGIFQSDTGEILLRTKERRLSIITPRTEAVTLGDGESGALSGLQKVSASVAGCVAVCAMDGQPLRESRRLVLVYNTDSANTGMVVSPDRTILRKLGNFPPLMRTGTLKLTLANTHGATLQVWALRMDGTRRERLNAQATASGLTLSIDTAALANGPTPFFEIAEK